MNVGIVLQTIELGKTREAEDARLQAQYLGNLGLSIPGGPNDQAFLDAPRPEEQALERYLQSLTPEHVWVLEALMYCGREKSADLAEILKHVKQTSKDKERAIDNMMGKTPLPIYLEEGLAFVGEPGLARY